MTYPPPAVEVPGLPSAGPATPAAVKDALGLGDTADTFLDGIVSAVNTLVRHLPIAATAAAPDTPEPDRTWPATIVQGANMLAARLYRRRNSPSGLESFADLGPVYVQRNDPDVGQLLALGTHSYPMIG